MTPENETKIEARLAALRSQMDNIPALLDGALLTKHNRTVRKDGSVHVSPEYFTFQYLAPDGKRAWKRIPKGARAVVERLVKAGTTYHKFSREYTALLTVLSLAGSKKKRPLIGPLPRPTFENIESVLRTLQTGPKNEDGLPADIKDFDRKLTEAAIGDVRSLLSSVFSHFGVSMISGAHSYRTKQVLTCAGWVAIRYAYVRGVGASALFSTLGVIGKATAAARDRAIRCAALCGSFAEGAGMLKSLCCMDLSTSKLRLLTLQYGQECLAEQNAPKPDMRAYPKHQPKDGETETTHTLFCMLDGIGAPCTKADTEDIKGKNGQAGTRQIRVGVFGEFQWLDKNNRPKCFEDSFSYVTSGEAIDKVRALIRKNGLARGYGTVPRMQCVADGEEALEKVLRDAFPDAIFTNDFFHASEHLHACCKLLAPDPRALQTEYRFSKGLLYRWGAESAIRRIEKIYPAVLDETSEAYKELDYLRKRKANMCYGKLRQEGLFIASGHVEAAVRVIVGRRCKQAGMHWRHNNAISMSAIIARMRSAA